MISINRQGRLQLTDQMYLCDKMGDSHAKASRNHAGIKGVDRSPPPRRTKIGQEKDSPLGVRL